MKKQITGKPKQHTKYIPQSTGKGPASLAELQSAEENSARLASIIQYSTDAILSKTLNGIITSWNPSAEKLYGYTAQEAIGKPATIVYPKELYKEHLSIMNRLRRGIPIRPYETKRMRKDGSLVDVSVSVSPIKSRDGKIIGGSTIAREITEEKRREHNAKFLSDASKLLSSSLGYQKTLNSIANLSIDRIADWCVIDMITVEGVLEMLAVAHRDPKQIKWARQYRQQNPPDLSSEVGVAAVLKTGKSLFYPTITDEMLVAVAKTKKELALTRKLGFTSAMMVPLIIHGKTVGVITFVATNSKRNFTKTDLQMAEELASRSALAIDNAQLYQAAQDEIREREHLETEQKQAKEQLNIILQNIADGVTVQDKQGRIVFANEAAAKLIGYSSAEELLETSSLVGVHKQKLNYVTIKDEKGNIVNYVDLPGRRALAGEKEPEMIVNYCYEDTGESRWSRIKARPIYDEQGNIQLAVNIIGDITQQKEIEERKDDFISMASHELKTPITSIKAFTQILHTKFAQHTDSDTLHYLTRMDDQLNKLTSLVRDLLDVSKIQAGKLELAEEIFNYDDLIAETVEVMQHTAPTHQLIIDGKTQQKICADKYRLSQVLVNLITNAVKYSPGKNKVIIHVQVVDGQLITLVEDFGIGIEKSEQRHIFERFYRADSTNGQTFSGQGLGLYIVSEIIRRYEGSIEVKSAPHKGSIFSFSLPLSAIQA